MADPRTTVERALGGAEVRPITLGEFHTRRERKRRNQRLAAGVLGVSIAVVGALIAARILDMNIDRTAGPLSRNGVIVFQGNRGLFEADAGGTESHMVVRRADPSSDCLDGERLCEFRGLAWSPDGTRLAFVFGEPSVLLLGDTSVYVMDAATEKVRLLASCPAAPGDPAGTCDDRNPLSWSPDGERIAISSGDNLFLVDAASGDMTQITGCGPCSYQGPASEPQWSPDGDRIAFTGNDLMLSVAVDGSAVQTLVRSSDARISINGAHPRWSPDGTKLAFLADEGVFVVNADGSGLRLLVSHEPSGGPGPSWSPDGRRILYVKTTGTRFEFRSAIRVIDVTGANDRVLYRSSCCVGESGASIFSPDGTMIAFRLDFGDRSVVFVMTVDGGDVHRLTGYGDPAWQALPR